MGHRANLLIVDDTGYQLYYCHWCANSLDVDLFWGPEYAIPFVQKQRKVDDDGWLKILWGQGGVVVDRLRQVILFFFSGDISLDIPLRRLYLELFRQVWAGWQVRWAHNGILDLADYVHVPRERVVDFKEAPSGAVSLLPPEKKEWTNLIGSITFEDNTLRLFPLIYNFEAFLPAGPQLVEVARNTEGLDHLPLDQWTKEFPAGGFHIDIPKQQLLCWNVFEQEITTYLDKAWDGWEVLWLGDAYEVHLERLHGKVSLPVPSVEVMLGQLEETLLVHSEMRSADDMAKLLQQAAQGGPEGTTARINENALRDDPLQIESAVRRRIFDQAVTAWKKSTSVSK